MDLSFRSVGERIVPGSQSDRVREEYPYMAKNVVFFLLFVVLLLGGIALFGLAPTLTSWQVPVFFAGILAVTASFAVPLAVLPKLD